MPEVKSGLPFAMASGQIDLEDITTPTVGVVKGGAVMEVDLPSKYIDNGRFHPGAGDAFGELDNGQHDRENSE